MKENKNYIDYAKEVFDYFERNGFKTGEGGPYLHSLDGKHGVDEIRRAKFLKHTIKNLILTGYLVMNNSRFLCLTQKGYDFTQGGVLQCNRIDLHKFVDLQRDIATQFNQLWEIIGKDDTALFYVDGKSYYDLASSLLDGLPYNYTIYVRALDKSRQSRSVWYRELYNAFDSEQKGRFLSALSDVISNIYEEYYPMKKDTEEDLLDWLTSPQEMISNNLSTAMQPNKKIKLFISHSSKDKKYVDAFVDLLMDLGVNQPEQMFCSSIPPFNVKLNDDIFDTLKDQYQKHQLFMIYMLSDNYYRSPVCLNEMGAGWVLQNGYLCVIMPGFSPDNIGGCVSATKKALVLDSDSLKSDLNSFKDQVVSMMGLSLINPEIWEMKRDRFIKAIAG